MRVMRRIALLAVLLTALLAGCNSSSEDSSPSTVASPYSNKDTQATSSKPGQIEGNTPYTVSNKFKNRFDNASGSETRTACSLLTLARVTDEVAKITGKRPKLKRKGTVSLDLSFCEFRADGIYMKLTLDTAPQTVIRYYYQITEAAQLPNLGMSSGGPRKLRMQQFPNIGDDSTYGGVGAFWEPSRNDLEAYKNKRIVGVVANLDGVGLDARQELAGELAKAMFEKLGPAAK
jgi:hypothetical protein